MRTSLPLEKAGALAHNSGSGLYYFTLFENSARTTGDRTLPPTVNLPDDPGTQDFTSCGDISLMPA